MELTAYKILTAQIMLVATLTAVLFTASSAQSNRFEVQVGGQLMNNLNVSCLLDTFESGGYHLRIFKDKPHRTFNYDLSISYRIKGNHHIVLGMGIIKFARLVDAQSTVDIFCNFDRAETSVNNLYFENNFYQLYALYSYRFALGTKDRFQLAAGFSGLKNYQNSEWPLEAKKGLMSSILKAGYHTNIAGSFYLELNLVANKTLGSITQELNGYFPGDISSSSSLSPLQLGLEARLGYSF